MAVIAFYRVSFTRHDRTVKFYDSHSAKFTEANSETRQFALRVNIVEPRGMLIFAILTLSSFPAGFSELI